MKNILFYVGVMGGVLFAANTFANEDAELHKTAQYNTIKEMGYLGRAKVACQLKGYSTDRVEAFFDYGYNIMDEYRDLYGFDESAKAFQDGADAYREEGAVIDIQYCTDMELKADSLW